MTAAIVQTACTPVEVRNTVLLALQDPAVEAFHKLWYSTPTTWGMTRYRGVPTMKSPFDMQMYHEIIMATRPGLIIETGTAYGGSALHFADCQQMAGVTAGAVLSIDVEARQECSHPGVVFHAGSSTSVHAQTAARAAAADCKTVLVSLDSDHTRAHVAAELNIYAELVTPGSFLVVEDTNIGGHPVESGGDDGGPLAAVDAFLSEHAEFVREPLCERYLLTMHPGGWLRRVA